MLTPEYLQNVPDNMIKLYDQAEADILADMARRISTYDYWIPAVEHQTKMLEEAGMVREDILARLKKLTGKTKKELRELMQDAGNVALKSDDEVYKRNGLDPPPIGASKDLQQILQAGYDKTSGTFQNLTMTTVRTATRQFEQALDRAYMQITMGGMDYNTSIRRAIKQLSADGVGAIKYPSGRVDSIEVAVRRALVTGVNQTALRLQDARADEVGSDLVEVSAHSGARPEHAKWQGGIYSRSGKSKKYPDFVKVTGYGTGAGLGGWNCSHSYRPWFEGMSRTWGKEQLADYQAKDYEYNGVKMTEYEALQEQRKIERGIRRWKREKNAMEAAGLDSGEASAKVREWNRKHKDFLEQTGLKADGTRLVVGKGKILKSEYIKPKPTENILKSPFTPAKSIDEAQDFAREIGIKYPVYENLPLETVNELNKAAQNLPRDARPIFVGDSKTLEQYFGGQGYKLPRKAKDFYGVTLEEQSGIHLGYGKGYDFETHGSMVGISTSYKTPAKITKNKLEQQAKYEAKYGNKWFYNLDGKATIHHEMGHCYINKNGLPSGFEEAAKKWAKESGCDMLKKPEEAFCEAWGAYYSETNSIPEYIEKYIKEIERKTVVNETERGIIKETRDMAKRDAKK